MARCVNMVRSIQWSISLVIRNLEGYCRGLSPSRHECLLCYMSSSISARHCPQSLSCSPGWRWRLNGEQGLGLSQIPASVISGSSSINRHCISPHFLISHSAPMRPSPQTDGLNRTQITSAGIDADVDALSCHLLSDLLTSW